jgi:seryl-tRNA synthetase
MHDIKWIRDYPDQFDAALKKRGLDPHSSVILVLDEKHRSTITEAQELQQRRNDVAKEMGRLKSQGQDAAALIEEGSNLKNRLAALETEERSLKEELQTMLATLPNLPKEDVPTGKDETDNKTVRTVGDLPKFSFAPKEHFDLGESLGLMDFEQAAVISGSRFVILKGALAKLERALAQFMLDTHTEKFGYTETSVPLLVNDNSMFGSGQLPKFAEDSFKTQSHWLIATGEIPLTNFVAQTVLEEAVLPLRYTAYTPCFRSEAGSAGKDTRGMLRQHQFYKVELVSITRPDQSDAELERMTHAAETILQELKIPYRVQLLCSGDMGFCSRKTYDLEAWLPGQNLYREISSCSTCGDFQARRMNARFKLNELGGQKTKPQFLHTLNGSGLAVGRTLIALLENYQQEDGSIRIPDVLVSYMNGLKEIKKQ